jgi:hypothetical protein
MGFMSSPSEFSFRRAINQGVPRTAIPEKTSYRTLKYPCISLSDFVDKVGGMDSDEHEALDVLDKESLEFGRGTLAPFISKTYSRATSVLKAVNRPEYLELCKRFGSKRATSKLRKKHYQQFRDILRGVRQSPRKYGLHLEEPEVGNLGVHVLLVPE